MKKWHTVLTVLAALVMVLSLSACDSKEAAETTPATTVENTETQAAPAELNLTEWSLSASTWSSPNGATIHLTAVPTRHEDGDSAAFIVRLEGEEAANVPCTWEGGAYVAAADLNAADGYCYYVALTGADGTAVEVAVNTPAEPIEENYINMESALESYCSLTLGESTFADGKLTLADGTALVQAPRITDAGSNVACAQATLVLTMDGQEIGSAPLTMAPGEADRSYEASLAGVSFEIPGGIGADQQLSLQLDAQLTNGQSLSTQGGSWYYQDGTLANALG